MENQNQNLLALQRDINILVHKLEQDLAMLKMPPIPQKSKSVFWPKIKNFFGKLWHGNNWKESIQNYFTIREQTDIFFDTLLEDFYPNNVISTADNLTSQQPIVNNIKELLNQFKNDLQQSIFKHLSKPMANTVQTAIPDNSVMSQADTFSPPLEEPKPMVQPKTKKKTNKSQQVSQKPKTTKKSVKAKIIEPTTEVPKTKPEAPKTTSNTDDPWADDIFDKLIG